MAAEGVELGPGERASVGTGVRLALPEGTVGLVVPRSGLALRHGLTLVNTPGVIDAGYRGELRVIVLNTDRASSYVIAPGDRIAQLIVLPIPRVEFLPVGELPDGVRGDAGFGSSGYAHVEQNAAEEEVSDGTV